jgi:hypothetical protein
MTEDIPFTGTNLDRFLFREEEKIVVGNFRGYFLTKRYNFVATINNHPEISVLYFRLDQSWIEALERLEYLQNHDWIVPTQLTIFCFRELRLAAELLFSCCTTPGNSHLRTAIESFAQAHKIMREPELGSVWLAREENRAEYDKHFRFNFKDNMFPENSGFDQLHRIWKLLCDAGPHPNVNSLGISSSTKISGNEVNWRLEFFEVDQREITSNILMMLQCGLGMLISTHTAFHERLSKEPEMLSKVRAIGVEFSRLRAKYLKIGGS